MSDDAGTKQIGVGCRSCGNAISWDSNYCPECGENFPFRPKIKKMMLGGSVPTAREAARDYKENTARHEALLAAAFAAGNDENASPRSTNMDKHGVPRQDGKRRKRKKGGSSSSTPSSSTMASRKGVVVKPHTFSSYGVSTSKQSGSRRVSERHAKKNVAQTETLESSTRKRRKRLSAYDASLARLLEKEPELEHRATLLDSNTQSISDDSGVVNQNAHITDVLTTLCKIERAEGNLLPASSYERAARSLSTYAKPVHSAKDMLGVRNIDNVAAAKIEEILEAETRRNLGGGRDVMEHASDLIAAFARQSLANKSHDQAAQAARMRLTAMLEEEQERERERESFWREADTQERTDTEKQELLAIFEEERRQASDNILALLPEVLGREKALAMVTGMDAAGAPPATPAELYRDTLPGMVDSGWLGASAEGGSALLPRTSIASSIAAPEVDNLDGQEAATPLPAIAPLPSSSFSALGGSDSASQEELDNGPKDQAQSLHKPHLQSASPFNSPPPTDMLPSLLPFAHQVLETEDEISSRNMLPGYKKNTLHVEKIPGKRHAKLSNSVEQAAGKEEEYAYTNLRYHDDAKSLRQQRYLTNSMLRHVEVKEAQRRRHAGRIRKRPRMIPPNQHKANTDVLVHVLDDDREPIVPDLSSVFGQQGGELDQNPGRGPSALTSSVSSGLFWGPGLSVTSGISSIDVERIASTTTTTAIAGGGAFWGAKFDNNRGEKMHKESALGRQEVRDQDFADRDISADEDESRENDSSTGVHDRSWQRRQTKRLRIAERRNRRRKKLTKYAWSRVESAEQVRCQQIVKVDTSDRAPAVGGIGSLKKPKEGEGKQNEDENSGTVLTPMLSASCRIPGSVNNGRGEYGIITIMSVAQALTKEAGGGSDATKTGDIVIRGYLPRFCGNVETELTREEVIFLLGTVGSENGSEAPSDSEGVGNWFHASQVQSYGASLRYMRPYWKKHVGPLLTRLEMHEEPIGGKDFSTRVPCLQIDRCVVSKTRVHIPPVDHQQYMSSSFPPNVLTSTVIVRLERRARPKQSPMGTESKKSAAVRMKKLSKYEEEPGGDLALSCTVVFRGNMGGGASNYSLTSTTCRCVLPFPAIAKRIEVVGLGPNVSALDIVKAGKRDALIETVVSHLRLAMLSPSKFSRAVPLSEISSGAHELQLLFDWQRPRRDLIVGDPVDDKIVKFLAPYQREMIKLYREAMVSLVPSGSPPKAEEAKIDVDNTSVSIEVKGTEKDRSQMEETAALRIQTQARQWLACEKVEVLRNIRNDEAMLVSSSDEEVHSEDEDSDAEEFINLHYRLHQACHLNGKLVDLRMRVCDIANTLTDDGSSTCRAVHVKVVEPKGRKIARLCVEGDQLDRVSENDLPDMNESPLSGVPSVEAEEPLAMMCVKLFHSLSLFQSRARGILLLKLKDSEVVDREDGGDTMHSEDNSETGVLPRRTHNVERKLSSQKSLTSLAHSPNVIHSDQNVMLGEGKQKSTGQALQKAHDASTSPSIPSAPKASRGAPPSLEESVVGDEELEDEEALKTYRPEVLMAAAARNWKPDSSVARPDDVPKLPLKRMKSRRLHK